MIKKPPRLCVLQGLLAHPSQGRAVVEEALQQEEAAVRIQRLWRQEKERLTLVHRKPRKRRRRNASKSSVSTTTTTTTQEHWLWQSLRAASTAERTAACRLLLSTLEGTTTNSTETSTVVTSRSVTWQNEHQRYRWIGPLLRLFQTYVLAPLPLVITPTNSNTRQGLQELVASVNTGPPDRLALEWAALLTESSSEALTESQWQWLCRSIWTLAVQQQQQNGTEQTVALASLVHWCLQVVLQRGSSFVWKAPVTTAERTSIGITTIPVTKLLSPAEESTAASTTTSLSIEQPCTLPPLACLVGAYYNLNPSERVSSGDSQQLLSWLVDLNSVQLTALQQQQQQEDVKDTKPTTDAANQPAESPRRRSRTLSSLVEGYDSDFAANEPAEANATETTQEDSAATSQLDLEKHDGSEDEDMESMGDEHGNEEREEEERYSEHDSQHDDDDEEVGEEEDVEAEEDEEDDDIDSGEEMMIEQRLEFGNDPMDIEQIAAAVQGSPCTGFTARNNNPSSPPRSQKKTAPVILKPPLGDRQRMYVTASMQVLATQYPHTHQHLSVRKPYLSVASEAALLKSVNKIICPPKKPLTTKVLLRRAPTQEEFFRGSLSQNPVPICSLKPSGTTGSSSTGTSAVASIEQYEPTVADLRQHIANELQMADSAELIEILVANKILDTRLKLRVVHQVLWREHLLSDSSAGLASYLSSGGGGTIFSRGSGLSIFFSPEDQGDRRTVTEDTPMDQLPALLATYRLAGVDGEATEDTVEQLVDPEAPSNAATPEEAERRLEAKFGITGLVAEDRGVNVLLRSIQQALMDVVRRIRRDDDHGDENPTRARFKVSPPCQALTLLRYCSKLPRNRKKLLQARAPTILLTLLLEVLKALEVGSDSSTGGNPTAEVLQELIEILTSDISKTLHHQENMEEGYESDLAQDAASMPLLLKSIETISLSPPLRSIIAKLLPFLTYGKVELSRELAQHFDRNISLASLAGEEESILMRTFMDTAISLPANEICGSLRLELIHCGFVDRLTAWIMRDLPKQPPTWSPALWPEGEIPKKAASEQDPKEFLKNAWRLYYARKGVASAFKILTGLCQKHGPTQERVAKCSGFLQACHWIESTSDLAAADISTHGFGILAETLLDESTEGNEKVSRLVQDLRKQTKLRKRNIAQQRRRQALLKMQNVCAPATVPMTEDGQRQPSTVRDAAASLFGPVFGLFRDSGSAGNSAVASTSESARSKNLRKKHATDAKKPSWLAEAESMVEETGLKCAVCQEGRTLQPKELLGLYVYTKKVSLPGNKNSSRSSIDGSDLLRALPSRLPSNLVGDPFADEWFTKGLEGKAALCSSLPISQLNSRRDNAFTTTVSAGNAIHISCHRRARQADRNSRAPKSEWEGASLRNNRVDCNAIIPLVSSQSSSVPLMHVNAGLSDYQSSVANMIGSSSTSMLWPVLHDARFLLLRIAYGESLNADCGGGSMASNCRLLFYQMHLAEMFDKEAQVDERSASKHARGLSGGCLLACSHLFTQDTKTKPDASSLSKAVADASPMAALTSIVFNNCLPCGGTRAGISAESQVPHPKREWLVGRELFLRGLLMCAGRRHVLNLNSSGCQSSRTASGRKRSSSFADWEEANGDTEQDRETDDCSPGLRPRRPTSRSKGRAAPPTVDDFQNAFRPMLTLFAILDKLSAEFTLHMSDIQIEESSQRLVEVIGNCQRSRSIHDLIRKAKVPLDTAQMLDLLQRGMILA